MKSVVLCEMYGGTFYRNQAEIFSSKYQEKQIKIQAFQRFHLILLPYMPDNKLRPKNVLHIFLCDEIRLITHLKALTRLLNPHVVVSRQTNRLGR